jgi:hypothetical protein
MRFSERDSDYNRTSEAFQGGGIALAATRQAPYNKNMAP